MSEWYIITMETFQCLDESIPVNVGGSRRSYHLRSVNYNDLVNRYCIYAVFYCGTFREIECIFVYFLGISVYNERTCGYIKVGW